MAYVDQAALTTRFGEDELRALAPDGSGGIDADTVQRACSDAEAEIDARLNGAGYATPLSPVPAALAAHAADIARYRLYDDQVSDVVKGRYDDAMRFLRAIARGDVKLGEGGDPSPAEATVEFQSTPGVFPGGGF
ncbi:DUF1320 domain-containing protein [Modicisalibacter sp. MOD 31.J]|uniref:gp436 family protein n=1 Tax=Modicisalibacter sp. MOD 31.J TaxID=2831897 RepID=UPI001CCE38AB|nr:DUF1320 domain-containing protein [Modicisalibacter sp. MOD 31.J]MBZ9574415.1 DUF1320 domain-containing protein [Modicisalibacter sp. MOD 31.J]